MAVICEKCKEPMQKIRSINASNSRFEFYSCSACGHEKQICLGLIK